MLINAKLLYYFSVTKLDIIIPKHNGTNFRVYGSEKVHAKSCHTQISEIKYLDEWTRFINKIYIYFIQTAQTLTATFNETEKLQKK